MGNLGKFTIWNVLYGVLVATLDSNGRKSVAILLGKKKEEMARLAMLCKQIYSAFIN